MATPVPLRILESQARVYRRTWRGSVFSAFVSPILYLLAMGVALGSVVDASAAGGVEGLPYLVFLAPGLLAASAMQTGAGEGSYPVMAGIKWLKTYQAALATPVSSADILLGTLGWAAVRVAMVCVVFAVVMVGFDAASPWGALLSVGPALLTGVAMAAPVMAWTARLEKETGLANLFRFVVVPMFLFSGTFFPVGQLPDWIEWVAWITPLWHGVDLARAAALPEVTTTFPPWVSTLFLVAVTVVGTVLALRAFERRLVT